jgi:hypothetical protein
MISNRVVISNWRRFPRARVACDVLYGDRFQSWHSHTRDISFGGCRLAGYYPFSVGKPLALKMTHPAIAEPVAITGRVAHLYGGAQNAVGLVFDRDTPRQSRFESWVRKVIASDPSAERTITRMPDQISLDALLRRGSPRQPGRLLSAAEAQVLERLDRAGRPVPLLELRKEWGNDWERRAQVLFDLIADALLLCLVPAAEQPKANTEKFAVDSFFKASMGLMKQLEKEYGPLDKGFARELEAISKEVAGTNGSATNGSARAKGPDGKPEVGKKGE